MPRGVDELPFPTDTASLWIFIREEKFSDAKDIQLTHQGKVVHVIRPTWSNVNVVVEWDRCYGFAAWKEVQTMVSEDWKQP